MNKTNSEYTIWYQGFGIDVGTKTFYNPMQNSCSSRKKY